MHGNSGVRGTIRMNPQTKQNAHLNGLRVETVTNREGGLRVKVIQSANGYNVGEEIVIGTQDFVPDRAANVLNTLRTMDS